MWRFNIIYKEQGTISIIELLAHKQNPLQSKQVFWTSCGFSASAPARALLSFIFKTNALNIVMVRLVDAAGNNVTDYRADQPWEVLISAACNGPLLPPPVSRSILKCTTRSDLLPPLTPPSPSSTPDELLHLRDPLVMCL